VAQHQFLLKNPGQSHCPCDQATFCLLWLVLDSACDTHQSITTITVRIWPKHQVYIWCSHANFVISEDSLFLHLHIIYLKKHFMNLVL
jgi:hypothetical protein